MPEKSFFVEVKSRYRKYSSSYSFYISLLIVFLFNNSIYSNDIKIFNNCENDKIEKFKTEEKLEDKLKLKNNKGMSLLAYCLEKRAEKSALYLLAFKNDLFWKDINNYNLAILSTRAGLKKPLQKILELNPSLLTQRDRFGLGLLEHAILRNRKELISFFKDTYSDYFLKLKKEMSVMEKALDSRSIEILSMVVDSRPSLKENEESYLMQKTYALPEVQLRYLLSLNFNPDAKDGGGNTLLHKLAFHNRSDLIGPVRSYSQGLLKNKEGQSPLHIASRRGKTEALKALLEWNGNAVEVDNSGNTPLHYAAQYGDSEMMYMLMISKSELGIKNKKGETPLTIAKLSGNDSIYYLLLLGGATE